MYANDLTKEDPFPETRLAGGLRVRRGTGSGELIQQRLRVGIRQDAATRPVLAGPWHVPVLPRPVERYTSRT